MYHYKQQIRINYQMASPPNLPTLTKQQSRGISLFDRQVQLHGHNADKPPPSLNKSYTPKPLPPLKSSYSISSPPVPTSSVTHQHQSYSPVSTHHRSPSTTTEPYTHSNNNNNNVQLLSVHPRHESNYMKEIPPPAPLPPKVSSTLLETDFPLYENSDKEETEYAAVVENAFDYLTAHDDDDDDVIHQESVNEQEDNSDSFDDENEDTYDVTTSIQNHQIDSGNHTLSSTGTNDKSNDNNLSQEKLNEQQASMARLSRTTVSEEYDSDFDDSSHEEVEQITHQDSINEHDEEQEHQNQIILRQQQILWGIVQEWLRKEELYSEQLNRMEEQLNQITISKDFQSLIQQLIDQHNKVYQEIKDLYKCDHQSANLTRRLTHTVEILIHTLPAYDDYIKLNLAPIRKSLEKRTNTNGLSSEDLLSIPTKQFLQILSQVQDLYQIAQSFESGDMESITRLYNCAQRCRLYGSRQDENINNVILKNEDVATMSSRKSRDRCRLILYPDAIVCCNLKTKLLTSPKYALLWFIPMLDLHWSIPQSPSDDNTDTGDKAKTTLKSAYRDIERTAKGHGSVSAHLKNIRKQEIEFNLSQSKLQLILLNLSRTSTPLTILFSSAYQRQDWIDVIYKTKEELIQRISSGLKQTTQQQRLNDSLIQKRLDLIKPNLHETNSNDLPSTSQTISTAKTYSGTLSITIHSIHGPALYNPIRQYQTLPIMSSTQQQIQKNYQFYVAVEIDSYNTFYPYAQTSKQYMQQPDIVEFKREAFEVELEYSLAFRLLIYRIDVPSGTMNNNSSQSPIFIGKFHRDIETALRDSKHDSNGVITLESQSGDLKLKISLKYFRRDGTFKRQGSTRSLAVFGKSIEKLLAVPNGLINDIPRIIVKCIEMVERDGLTETGIYRVCCVASELQKLRHEFDKNSYRAEESLAKKNVHVAANLLKLFFRELPEPLFTSTLYKQFLHAIQLTDIDNQRVTLLKTFELLHTDNRKILFYLFDHLIRVSQYSKINMMHLDNLAVVFGPTLMRPSRLILTTCFDSNNQRVNPMNGQTASTDLDQMSSELQGSMYQCQVVLTCLKLRQDGILK